jgi:hypothetical protein
LVWRWLKIIRIRVFREGKSVMMKCNWPKWLFPWAILPLGLGAAALLFNSDSLEDKLKAAADSQLASGGAGWASVTMDGRDAKLAGEAPEQGAISNAAKLVAGTYGVRRVDSSGVTVAPPVSSGAADRQQGVWRSDPTGNHRYLG